MNTEGRGLKPNETIFVHVKDFVKRMKNEHQRTEKRYYINISAIFWILLNMLMNNFQTQFQKVKEAV